MLLKYLYFKSRQRLSSCVIKISPLPVVKVEYDINTLRKCLSFALNVTVVGSVYVVV